MLAAKKPLDTGLYLPQQHYDMLHTGAHGTAIVWERSATGKQWLKLAPDAAEIPYILAAQCGKKDSYLSVNEFYSWRIVRQLKSLRACYVDIDGCTDLKSALEKLQEAQLPPPSAVVWSGRGMHLYWLHEPVPARALPVWQRVQDKLLATLKPIGGDPMAKDCTRVLRIVGSLNGRTNSTVHGRVLDPQPWPFRHLCDEVLGYRDHKPAKVKDISVARAEKGLRPRTGSIYDRWYLVYQDLLKIADWHFLGGIPETFRDKWLFLTAVSLSWFANPATLASEIHNQAKLWTPGLTMAEVKAAYKQPLERAQKAYESHKDIAEGTSEDPRYKFKRETLYELLGGIIPPALEKDLRAIISDGVRQQHRRETDAKRWNSSRTEYLEQFKDSKESLKPWVALGISRATYYRKQAKATAIPADNADA